MQLRCRVMSLIMMGGALGLAVLASVAASRTNHLVAAGTPHLAALVGGYRSRSSSAPRSPRWPPAWPARCSGPGRSTAPRKLPRGAQRESPRWPMRNLRGGGACVDRSDRRRDLPDLGVVAAHRNHVQPVSDRRRGADTRPHRPGMTTTRRSPSRSARSSIPRGLRTSCSCTGKATRTAGWIASCRKPQAPSSVGVGAVDRVERHWVRAAHPHARVFRDGETLDLGVHKLRFMETPHVHHWDSMMVVRGDDRQFVPVGPISPAGRAAGRDDREPGGRDARGVPDVRDLRARGPGPSGGSADRRG